MLMEERYRRAHIQKLHTPSREQHLSHCDGMKKQTNAEYVIAMTCILRKDVVITADGNVPDAYWNRENRQANLDRDDPDNRDGNYGVRSSVRA